MTYSHFTGKIGESVHHFRYASKKFSPAGLKSYEMNNCKCSLYPQCNVVRICLHLIDLNYYFFQFICFDGALSMIDCIQQFSMDAKGPKLKSLLHTPRKYEFVSLSVNPSPLLLAVSNIIAGSYFPNHVFGKLSTFDDNLLCYFSTITNLNR
jgi:hypothetical protein